MSFIVTLPFALAVAALTFVAATTLLSEIVKSISLATAYLLASGDVTSCIVYFPSGRLFNVVGVLPVLNVISVAPDSASRSELFSIVAPVPAVTFAVLNTIPLFDESLPVIVIVAPGSGSSSSLILLISTLVPTFSFWYSKLAFLLAASDVSIVPLTTLVSTVHVAPEPVVFVSVMFLSTIPESEYGDSTASTTS